MLPFSNDKRKKIQRSKRITKREIKTYCQFVYLFYWMVFGQMVWMCWTNERSIDRYMNVQLFPGKTAHIGGQLKTKFSHSQTVRSMKIWWPFVSMLFYFKYCIRARHNVFFFLRFSSLITNTHTPDLTSEIWCIVVVAVLFFNVLLITKCLLITRLEQVMLVF